MVYIVYDVSGPPADGRLPLFMIGQPMDASGFLGLPGGRVFRQAASTRRRWLHTSGCRLRSRRTAVIKVVMPNVDEQMVRPIRVVDNPFVRSSRALDYSTLRYG